MSATTAVVMANADRNWLRGQHLLIHKLGGYKGWFVDRNQALNLRPGHPLCRSSREKVATARPMLASPPVSRVTVDRSCQHAVALVGLLAVVFRIHDCD